MSNQRIKIPRQSDKKVWGVFKDLASQYSVPQINVGGIGFASIGAVNPESPSDEMKALLAKNSSIIDSMSLPIPGYSIGACTDLGMRLYAYINLWLIQIMSESL